MFGKKTEFSDGPTTQKSQSSSMLHNSLVNGTKLEGDVHSSTDFRIDGVFIGNLNCDARVIIGPGGEFDGTVFCENAIVEGRFNGKLNIRQVLEVKEGAVIEGDVVTNKLVVHSGSVFDVNCTMGVTTDNRNEKNNKEETIKLESNGIEA